MILKDVLSCLWKGEEIIVETKDSRVFRGTREGEIEERFLEMNVFMIASQDTNLLRITIE